jgi:aryl-alcohol dehydrogenase-like predicted oxidoreductase
MEYRTLGKTGLEVSVMGIGTGGPSQFGQKSGVSEQEVVCLVQRGLELGINFFDSSAGYGESEEILGRALRGVPRDDYVLATKFLPTREGEVTSPADVVASVERSLTRLGVESVDIMQFHGVKPADYPRVTESLLPTLQKLQEQGKFRFLGLSETYAQDPCHETLPQALADGIFDTVMVGYNMLSPGVEGLLPACREQGMGVICMVAVRKGLSRHEYLLERLEDAGKRGIIERSALPAADPLGWLVKGEVESLPAAGYKYVAAQPAIGTVLSGTANLEHLEANVRAILGSPLPEGDVARLRQIFGQVQEPLGD